jgi:hypothetical protein
MGDYTSGSEATLPTDTTNLADHTYDATDLTAVASNDNSSYVGQLAAGEYAIHMFKDTVTGSSVDLTWSGKTDLAPSTSPVRLQVYKVAATAGWVNAPGASAVNNTAAADADFDLTSTLSGTTTPTLADCLDGSNVLACRVYQNYQGELWSSPNNTWVLSSGNLNNTPGISDEILSDPGLEATYTSGLCASLLKTVAPTLTDETSDMRSGSHAQKMVATAQSDSVRYQYTLTYGTWYSVSGYAKRVAGTTGGVKWLVRTGLATEIKVRETITSESYTQLKPCIQLAMDTTGIIYVQDTAATFDTVICDDFSLKSLTLADLFYTKDFGASTDVTVDVPITATIGESTPVGVVACLDSKTSPANFYVAYITAGANAGINTIGNQSKIVARKCINGVYTNLYSIDVETLTYAAGYNVKIVKDATTVKVYYNNVQKGETYTIVEGDPDGTIHGFFSTHVNATLDFDNATITAT